MRLTPIEIRAHRFRSRLRGYDTAEVDAFLETVVADFEAIVRENAQLRREGERLGRELDTHRSRERHIQQTLSTAQEMAEQLKRSAMKESEILVCEAELQAEKLLEDSRARRAALTREIGDLSHLRARLAHDLRHALDSYRSMVDAYEEAHAAQTPAQPRPDPDPA